MGRSAPEYDRWAVEVAYARSRAEFDAQLARARADVPEADVHIRWRKDDDGEEFWQAFVRRDRAGAGEAAMFVEVERDGWVWHDYTPLDGDFGDAWIEAPDGSYVGIVWSVGTIQTAFEQIFDDGPRLGPPEGQRWGVFEVKTTLPMASAEDAASFVEAAIPVLRGPWDSWRD